MHILIVEDEVRLADTIGEIMNSQKYKYDIVYDGQDALYYGESDVYDIIILDIMIPKLNGFEVAKKLREKKVSTPILMLTAKDEISDKVNGLDMGADDYLTKPFASEELLARVRALSRRQGEVLLDELEFEDLRLNTSTCTLYCGEKNIHLGFKESELMKLLMSNPKKVLSKDDLLIKVWGYESDAEDNNVEVYISFLRKKLSFLGSKTVISTIRRVGYFLEQASEG